MAQKNYAKRKDKAHQKTFHPVFSPMTILRAGEAAGRGLGFTDIFAQFGHDIFLRCCFSRFHTVCFLLRRLRRRLRRRSRFFPWRLTILCFLILSLLARGLSVVLRGDRLFAGRCYWLALSLFLRFFCRLFRGLGVLGSLRRRRFLNHCGPRYLDPGLYLRRNRFELFAICHSRGWAKRRR